MYMAGSRSIVEELARQQRVEAMLKKISGTDTLSGDLADLAQDVYLILLEYDEGKIVDLQRNGQINFFIARILVNQCRSSHSPFYRNYRRSADHARLGDNLMERPGGVFAYMGRDGWTTL